MSGDSTGSGAAACAGAGGAAVFGGTGAAMRSWSFSVSNRPVAVLRTVVAEQKSGVSTFISDQVKSWDMGQLISLIEINIGRDLQYIRFNGSLIGGLAGLALYTLEYLLRLL